MSDNNDNLPPDDNTPDDELAIKRGLKNIKIVEQEIETPKTADDIIKMVSEGKKSEVTLVRNSTNNVGRYSTFTAEKQKIIIQCILLGMTMEHAAQKAMTSVQTMLRWLQWGAEQEVGVFRSFYEAVCIAKIESQQRLIENINAAASPYLMNECGEYIKDDNGQKIRNPDFDWRASAFQLERRIPNVWAKKEMVVLRVEEIAKKLAEHGLTLEDIMTALTQKDLEETNKIIDVPRTENDQIT